MLSLFFWGGWVCGQQQNQVAALAKHYLAYGKAAGGQNVGQTEISERTLREVYLAPWRAMISEAGLRGLMPSHQTIFDVPVSVFGSVCACVRACV